MIPATGNRKTWHTVRTERQQNESPQIAEKHIAYMPYRHQTSSNHQTERLSIRTNCGSGKYVWHANNSSTFMSPHNTMKPFNRNHTSDNTKTLLSAHIFHTYKHTHSKIQISIIWFRDISSRIYRGDHRDHRTSIHPSFHSMQSGCGRVFVKSMTRSIESIHELWWDLNCSLCLKSDLELFDFTLKLGDVVYCVRSVVDARDLILIPSILLKKYVFIIRYLFYVCRIFRSY